MFSIWAFFCDYPVLYSFVVAHVRSSSGEKCIPFFLLVIVIVWVILCLLLLTALTPNRLFPGMFYICIKVYLTQLPFLRDDLHVIHVIYIMLEYVIVQLQEIYFYPFLFFYRPVFQGPFSFWSWVVYMCIIYLEFKPKETQSCFSLNLLF